MDADKEPKIVGCICFHGHRGMDWCSKCGGTGSRFLVPVNGQPRYFPNTEDGYKSACDLLRNGK